jgi:GR25 family glycosyltransferase involved in LPS biosynthesis
MAENLNAIVLRIDACDGLSESHQISPLEVNLSWDSTLNSSFDRNCVLNNSIPMTPSERGCIASHIKAWRIIANFGYDMDMSLGTSTHRIHSLAKVVQRSHYQRKEYKGYLNEIRKQISDWYIICEDDAIICTSEVSNDRLVSTIDKITRSIPETADICYLGYCIPQGTHPIKYNKLLIKPNYLWQLHSYMLTTRSAKKILSFLPVSEPVDNFLAHLIYDGKLEVYASYVIR